MLRAALLDDFGLKPLRPPADEDLHDLIAERALRGRIPNPTGSYSPARNARRHLNGKFALTPCSIAGRARIRLARRPASRVSVEIRRGDSECLCVKFSSVLLLTLWSPLLVWGGLLWQHSFTPSRRRRRYAHGSPASVV